MESDLPDDKQDQKIDDYDKAMTDNSLEADKIENIKGNWGRWMNDVGKDILYKVE